MPDRIRISALSLATLLVLLAAPAAAQDDPGAPKPPVVSLPPGGGAVPGAPEAPIAERVVFALSGYEYMPTRADLDRIGPAPAVVDALLSMIDDDARRASLRLRAVDALGYYGDRSRAIERLESLALWPAPLMLEPGALRIARAQRHRAILGLARALGPKSVPLIVDLLEPERDIQIRLSAIHALGKRGGPAGMEALRELARRENGPIVARELRKFVRD